MSDSYFDIPDIEPGELDKPIPTYNKNEGNEQAEKFINIYLDRFGEEPSKERLDIIRIKNISKKNENNFNTDIL